MVVLLALCSALVYGAADFSGGLATRRAGALAVVAVSQLAGLAGVLLLLPLLGGSATTGDLLWVPPPGWPAGPGWPSSTGRSPTA